MADFKKLAGSKVGFSVSIEKDEIEKAQKNVIERFRKHVTVKGFRKGHAPDRVVVSSIGISRLTQESFYDVVEKKYRAFVIDQKLSPIVSPKVDWKSLDKFPVKVDIEVEVFPEINLGDYKKIKVSPVKIDIKESEIDDVAETVMTDMQLGKLVDRAAKEKDLVLVDFVGKDDKGDELPNTKGEKTPFRLGMGHFLPDLEKAFTGMKAGETKEKVVVKFPKEYHAKDMAGKKVFFDIALHEVKEVSVKNLTEDDIELALGQKKTVTEFREDIKSLITGNKKKAAQKDKIEAYKKDLLKKIKMDLPSSWIESEVIARMNEMKNSPQYAANPDKFWDSIGKKEDQVAKEFATQAEEGLKSYLALSEVIKTENIELNKDEMEVAHQRVHQNPNIKGHQSSEHDQVMQREMLNLKMDKFFDMLFS